MENNEIRYESELPRILVAGIGGGGNNAVNRMIDAELKGVSFVAVNTDCQALEASKAENRIQIGRKATGGFGCGADPSIGEAAAIESEEEIKTLLQDYDMIILTCGMGGGTGTGAIPVIASLSKELGLLTIAVVTMPFLFEGNPRRLDAEAGLEKLKDVADTILVIPNDKLLEISEEPLELEDGFLLADSVLKYAISGITNIIFNKGMINLDFNDLKTTLAGKGIGHLGIGIAGEGESPLDAVKQAVNSPLLDTSIEGAQNLLINTCGKISMRALNEAVTYVRNLAGESVNIIWGTVTEPGFDSDSVIITVIATGMPDHEQNDPSSNQEQPIPFVSSDTVGNLSSNVNVPCSTPLGQNNSAGSHRSSIDVPVFLNKYRY